MRRVLLLVTLLAACEKSKPAPAPATPAPTPAAAKGAAKPEGAPDGVVAPNAGKLRKMNPGTPRTAYLWQGIYEVDPEDPVIKARLARELKEGWHEATPGYIGVLLHREQIGALGIKETDHGPMFTYPCAVGDVFVQHDKDDPVVFTLSVSPPGG